MGAAPQLVPSPAAGLLAFVRQTPLCLAIFDRELRYLAASPRWRELYGNSRGDLVGLALYEQLPELPQAWHDVHRRGLAGETVNVDGEPWPQPDGRRRWVSWGVLPWWDGDQVGGLILWIEDITARKLGEEQLRESARNYRVIFEESPFGIALIRQSDQVVVDANPAFLAMFELAREDAVGRTTIEVGLADFESQAQLDNELEAHGAVRELVRTRRTRAGEQRVISLNVDRVTIGGVDHTLTTVRDLTELRRVQELDSLYRRATELDELKTRFFASVSHELRTPLTLILGPAERMLASSELTEDQRHDLGVIARNAHTLLHHVNNLLDVSKLEARRMTVEYADVDLSQLVRLVAGHFESLADDKTIAFAIEVPDGVRVQVDPTQIQRVLLNLLSNAFKVTPGGGRVRVTLRVAGRDRVRLEVADSGPGVPKDMRHLIFEPFRQLEGGQARQLGGTGLGLAIARELVALHRGTIVVDDAPEGGARFAIVLPERAPPGMAIHPAPVLERGFEDVRTAAQELREAAPRRLGRLGERGPLVLVVEDNPEMNEFLAEHLARDHRIETAYDGREGLRKALALQPDLILTDLMMPGLSGEALVHELRARRELDRVPIVLLTAKADEALRVQLLREGAQDYVHKPFSLDELSARVDNLIARKLAEDRASQLQHQLEDVAAANLAVTEAIASIPESSVHAVLHTIALRAQALTGAQYAAVGIGQDPAAPFEPWVFVGMDPALLARLGRAPRPVGVLGLAARAGVQRLRDLRDHPEFRGVPPGHPTMTSFLAVPIAYHGTPIGTVYLANKQGAAEFSEQDQHVVEMLAGRVGVAIATAWLYHAVGVERSWLDTVIDQMPEAIVLVDANGRLAKRNQAAIALATSEPAPPGARDASSIELRSPSGETIADDDLPLARALREEHVTQALELVAHCGDGRQVPVLVTATPIRMTAGQLAGATLVLQDISALKELEQLREEWASIVAHDLQQPINAIVLLAEALLRGEHDARDRERIERVRTLSLRLGRMVSDLSDASLLETRRLTIVRERIELCSILHDVIAHMPELAGRASLSGPPHLAVRGDAARLEQVLTNLLANALKYGAADTPIRVELAEIAGAAVVSVTNHGRGISPEDMPRLFQRFVRVHDTRAAVKGSGLGLYIAKGIVEAHGGRIWAESTPGEITTFRFTIPLQPEDLTATARPAPPAEAGTQRA